jgi:hypothetical protein
MKSCLWEMELIMKNHYDEKMRNYAKVFKTDFLRKEAFYKCEEFTTVSTLDVIEQELNDINIEKEGITFKKNLLKIKYNELVYDNIIVNNSLNKYNKTDNDFNQQKGFVKQQYLSYHETLDFKA